MDRACWLVVLAWVAGCGDGSGASSAPTHQGPAPGAPTQMTESVGAAESSPGQGPPASTADDDEEDPFELGVSGEDDAGPGADDSTDAPLVTPSVAECGNQSCDITDGLVCCQGYSRDVGFVSDMECMPQALCRSRYDAFANEDHLVQHDCDGPEDCGTGGVCCFLLWGQPIAADIVPGVVPGNPLDSSMVVGPGAGRICASFEDCNTMIVEGTTTSLLACREDADCAPQPGTTCQPEQDGSLTTGAHGRARPGVLLCR